MSSRKSDRNQGSPANLRFLPIHREPVIALCGGGTGGHVMTAVALAECLHEEDPAARLLFVGSDGELERTWLGGRTDALRPVDCAPVARSTPPGRLMGAVRTARGTWQARRILLEHRVQVAIGVGAFASVPGVLAARLLGLPTAIVEVNARPGIANRFLAPLVDRVYLAHESTRKYFTPGRCRTTGFPVRAAITRSGREKPRTRTASRHPVILITGGSMGSSFLNREVPELIGRLAAEGTPATVVHQSGPGSSERVARLYHERGLSANVSDFFEDFPRWIHQADLVISSPGAATLAELCAAGTPCLLVPDRTVSEDHQSLNAREIAGRWGVPVETEERWDAARIAADLHRRLACPEGLRREVARLRAFHVPDAGAQVARDLFTMIPRT